jgi:hypothetical protein
MTSLGAIAGNLFDKIGSFFSSIGELLQATHLPEQIKDVDFSALFTNPWFLVPFIGFIGYQIYKQAFRDLFVIALLMGVWYVSGTEYMQTLVVGDELQVNKVLPLLFGGAVVVGIIIYLYFGRSD